MTEGKRKIKKKGFMQVVFGRTTIVMLAIVAQAAILLMALQWVTDYSGAIYSGLILLSAFVVIYILNEDVNSSYKIAWIVPVLLMPVFGAVTFVFVNTQIGTRKLHKLTEKMDTQVACLIDPERDAYEELAAQSAGEAGLARFLWNTGRYPFYRNNEVLFFPLGEDKFVRLLAELRKAKNYIFMEYFIVAEGYMWDTILQLLKEKVAQGVEVRFMYDGTCSLKLLPYGYYKKLRAFGIDCRAFSPIVPVLSTYQNNRDHRKIVVIDGEVAFTGGVNLADEYINYINRFGHWKDTSIMVRGESVRSFTYMFLKMWHMAGASDNIPVHDLETYLPQKNILTADLPEKEEANGRKGGFVAPYGDNPYAKNRIGRQVYIDILNRARKYVHITTPYLILDDELIAALRFCAQRGVETVIIMPHIPDKKLIYYLGRTYYMELLEYGVHIYEYTPGFVHAKEFISDDERASIGTLNLDYRSLYLHFECATYLYQNPAIMDMEQDFQDTLHLCREVTASDCADFPKWKLLLGQILKIFAPLL